MRRIYGSQFMVSWGDLDGLFEEMCSLSKLHFMYRRSILSENRSDVIGDISGSILDDVHTVNIYFPDANDGDIMKDEDFVNYLRAYFHEYRHVQQIHDCKTGKASTDILASQISDYQNRWMYRHDYEFDIREIDAEQYALSETYKYLRGEFGLSKQDAFGHIKDYLLNGNQMIYDRMKHKGGLDNLSDMGDVREMFSVLRQAAKIATSDYKPVPGDEIHGFCERYPKAGQYFEKFDNIRHRKRFCTAVACHENPGFRNLDHDFARTVQVSDYVDYRELPEIDSCGPGIENQLNKE